MIVMIILTVIVVVAPIYPVRKQKIDFDEKAEVIKIYREGVAYIKQQNQKELIDDDEELQLLNELDKKSVLAMQSIEQKTFAYRSPFVPVIIIVVAVMCTSALYIRFYTEQKVHVWHDNAEHFGTKIAEGLFNRHTIVKTLAQSNKSQKESYCFLLQQKMLSDYPQNAEVLINVAECHLQRAFAKPASIAIQRALTIDADNLRANYLYAELQFLKIQQIMPQTEKKLVELFAKNSEATDIGYLLMLNSFALGRSAEVQYYADKLQSFTEQNPVLKDAVDGLLAQSGESGTITYEEQAPSMENNHAQELQQTDKRETKIEQSKTGSAVAAEFKATITIDTQLREQIQTPKTLFIIVKSAQGQLLTAAKFTLEDVNESIAVHLIDGQEGLMQMVPMSSVGELVVTARLSQTGDTKASAGDLTSQPVNIPLPQGKSANIVIDRVVN